MAAFLVATLALALQSPGVETAIAVTRDGVRVEAYAPAVGDLALQTPLGRFSTPLDPVVAVEDGAAQLTSLRALRAAGAIDDDRTLLHDLATAGQLSAMAKLAARIQKEDPQHLLPYELLEAWAERLDPVPRDVKRDDRVRWLWERAIGDDFAIAVICGAVLAGEVPQSNLASSRRLLTLASFSEGLESRHVWARRATVRVVARQPIARILETVLERTLSEPMLPARAAAAAACAELNAHGARQYWALNLMRNEGALRIVAAQHLGAHGGDEGARALIYALSAWDRSAPERYDYDGRRCAVVKDHLRRAHELNNRTHHDAAAVLVDPSNWSPDPAAEFIDLGSVLKVSTYPEEVRRGILDALDRWAGEKTGRDAITWLHWHLQNAEQMQP